MYGIDRNEKLVFPFFQNLSYLKVRKKMKGTVLCKSKEKKLKKESTVLTKILWVGGR